MLHGQCVAREVAVLREACCDDGGVSLFRPPIMWVPALLVGVHLLGGARAQSCAGLVQAGGCVRCLSKPGCDWCETEQVCVAISNTPSCDDLRMGGERMVTEQLIRQQCAGTDSFLRPPPPPAPARRGACCHRRPTAECRPLASNYCMHAKTQDICETKCRGRWDTGGSSPPPSSPPSVVAPPPPPPPLVPISGSHCLGGGAHRRLQDDPACTLRALGTAVGLLMGSAANIRRPNISPEYQSVLAREFDIITPENSMKLVHIQATPGKWDFKAADEIIAWAEHRKIKIRAHNLVWTGHNPQWLVQGASQMTPLALNKLMKLHSESSFRLYSLYTPPHIECKIHTVCIGRI